MASSPGPAVDPAVAGASAGAVGSGPASGAALATGRNQDGRLEAFAVDPRGGLIHSWQGTTNGVWLDWQWMGVFVRGRPSVGVAPDGRLEVFALDLAGGVIHTWQLTPNGVWSGWQWMGVFAIEAPSIGVAPDGRLEVFAPDRAGGLIHAWQLTPNGIWSDWHWMGSFVAGSPSIGTAPDGRLEAFAVMPDGAVIHAWQMQPNGVWSDFSRMDATGRDAPSVGRAADGRLEVFAVDRFGGLQHTWQLVPNGPFGPWTWAGTSAQAEPAIGTAPDGRLELFAVDPNGGLVHQWQIVPNGGWSDWHWMGVFTREAPAIATSPDARLEVFATDQAGGVIHAWQLAPNGIWSDFVWMGVFALGGNGGSRFGVATSTLAFLDPSRPTVLASGERLSDVRRLTTTVYFPTTTGPYPLLVFVHGFNVSAATYAPLLADLARRGYVVAAPDFPLSSTAYPGPRQSDAFEQARDVSYLLPQLLAWASASAPVANLVDPVRIGVVGHSDGGITAAGLAFNSCCQDGRVKAAAVLTGAAVDFPGEWFPASSPVPGLFVHGTRDGVNSYANSTSMFARAHTPKYLLTLTDGTHLVPFVQSPFEPQVAAVVADFFDLHVAGRPNAQARLAGDSSAAGLTLQAG